MMVRRFGLTLTLLPTFCGIVSGQGRPSSPETPRQAIIEMLTGGETAFKKHLTVEMMAKLQEMTKDTPSSMGPFQALAAPRAADPDRFQAFDLGPVLFSFNNPQQHERYEVQIDSEDPRGDDAVMNLSLHQLRNGLEQEMPFMMRFVVNMKKQEGTWRLNALTFNATLPLGDPKILDKSWWGPALAASSVAAPEQRPIEVNERPKLSPLRAVRMIGMAEDIYAQSHPGIGYTCSIADLVNVGRGLDEDGVYRFMDAEFAEGVYNGYRFTLTGCDRRPARDFRVTAEPVAGKGKAYCSDHTNNVRASDDGRGVTCLIAGKSARR